MIYTRNDVDEGLDAIMFPVRKVDVYAEMETDLRERIPGKKALINTHSRRVLSVVSDRYRVLTNHAALKLARRCCIAAFPNTAPADWRVFSIEAPHTGGHCRIDLEHSGEILTYDWAFSDKVQDKWQPFVRMTNSYNRTRVFSLDFGFIRSACENGLIDWRSSMRVRFAHDTGDIESAIEREIDEAKFRKLKSEYHTALAAIAKVPISRDRFWAVIQAALAIRMPKDMPEDRLAAWAAFEWQVDQRIDGYTSKFGETAYALMNTITDVATRPPGPVCGHCLVLGEPHSREHEQPPNKRWRPHSFIQRERHSLQRLAGTWVAEFGRSVEQDGFDLRSYLEKPSRSILREASRRNRESGQRWLESRVPAED